eukprot:scaffold31815_cov18-Tisochrysis_lutea.AAC.1
MCFLSSEYKWLEAEARFVGQHLQQVLPKCVLSKGKWQKQGNTMEGLKLKVAEDSLKDTRACSPLLGSSNLTLPTKVLSGCRHKR